MCEFRDVVKPADLKCVKIISDANRPKTMAEIEHYLSAACRSKPQKPSVLKIFLRSPNAALPNPDLNLKERVRGRDASAWMN